MKKTTLLMVMVMIFSCFLAGVALAEKIETATGKVTSIDPAGKAIVISVSSGKEALNVGTGITPDTKIMVKGKKATLNEIGVGDTVTIEYVRTTDLFAKRILKK